VITAGPPPPSPAKLIALGTAAVGILDLADAFIFFGLRGAAPEVILRSIAAGLLGPDAFDGGPLVPVLGLGLHFFIAFGIVLTLYLIGRQWPQLRRHPILVGVAYGLAVWCVMNFVVVPLSAAGRGPFRLPVVINGLLIHIVGVGLPAAWCVLRPFAQRETSS
jgi:hypothetical protein